MLNSLTPDLFVSQELRRCLDQGEPPSTGQIRAGAQIVRWRSLNFLASGLRYASDQVVAILDHPLVQIEQPVHAPQNVMLGG